MLKIRYQPFDTQSRQATLPYPTDRDDQLAAAPAVSCWRRSSTTHRPVRLIGAGVSNLERARTQLSLLESRSSRLAMLDEQLDELRERYGDHVIARGAAPRPHQKDVRRDDLDALRMKRQEAHPRRTNRRGQDGRRLRQAGHEPRSPGAGRGADERRGPRGAIVLGNLPKGEVIGTRADRRHPGRQAHQRADPHVSPAAADADRRGVSAGPPACLASGSSRAYAATERLAPRWRR